MSDDTPRMVATFNLLDVEAEITESTNRVQELHDRLMASAEQKARDLLQKALDERDRVREEGRQEGYAAGLEEGRKEGRSLGEENLVEEQRDRSKASAERLIEALERTSDLIEREAVLMTDQSRRDLLKLSLAIAGSACAATVPSPGDQARNLISDLVRRLADRRVLTIDVHPEVLESLGTFADELRERFDEVDRIRLRGDETLEPGAVRVANEVTRMETSVADSLERLRTEWGL